MLIDKTDMGTKMAIREKLQSVEERVGLLSLASTQKKNQTQDSKIVQSYILSRVTSTITSITNKAYQSTLKNNNNNNSMEIIELDQQVPSIETTISQPSISMSTLYIEGGGDPMTRFKKLGQYMIDVTVTCAILIKQSPLPGNEKKIVIHKIKKLIYLFC
jgi:hypothetical protein